MQQKITKCSKCGISPPETETNYTLISPKHGWRLERSLDSEGNKAMLWFCPRCWTKKREGKEQGP